VAQAAVVVPVPAGLDLSLAAAAPAALATAELLVSDAGRLRAGETLLVHSAAGGVGQAVAQAARRAGAGQLIGTVGRADGVAAAQQAGYHAALVRGPALATAIRRLVGARGVDVILDPQGTALLDVDLELAAPGARIVLFGNATGAPLEPLPPAGLLFGANTFNRRLQPFAPGRHRPRTRRRCPAPSAERPRGRPTTTRGAGGGGAQSCRRRPAGAGRGAHPRQAGRTGPR
jgi:NADPH:quinone reductase-like Zn-dependent oxidoreductase